MNEELKIKNEKTLLVAPIRLATPGSVPSEFSPSRQIPKSDGKWSGSPEFNIKYKAKPILCQALF